MSEDMPDRMSEDMPERMPEDMSDRMSEDMPDRMSDKMPEDMPDRMPEDLPDRMPEDMPDRMPEDMSDRMPEDLPEDLPVRKCINVMVGIIRSEVISARGEMFEEPLALHSRGRKKPTESWAWKPVRIGALTSLEVVCSKPARRRNIKLRRSWD